MRGCSPAYAAVDYDLRPSEFACHIPHSSVWSARAIELRATQEAANYSSADADVVDETVLAPTVVNVEEPRDLHWAGPS